MATIESHDMLHLAHIHNELKVTDLVTVSPADEALPFLEDQSIVRQDLDVAIEPTDTLDDLNETLTKLREAAMSENGYELAIGQSAVKWTKWSSSVPTAEAEVSVEFHPESKSLTIKAPSSITVNVQKMEVY